MTNGNGKKKVLITGGAGLIGSILIDPPQRSLHAILSGSEGG